MMIPMVEKKLNVETRVKCATCGTCDYDFPRVELPEGYSLECDKCRQGSPGKPMKTVRHCSMCREPIIVLGVSGGVRLTCNQCAKKDPKLIEIEALVNERDKYREALNELHHNESSARVKWLELSESFDEQLAARVQEVADENLELKAQLNHKEEASLTDRLKMKMRLKYGESDRQRLHDFAAWLIEEAGWEGSRTKVIDVDEVLDRYLKDD
jgi:hypothetical protein